MHEMEIYSNYNFELYQENVTSEVEYMRESPAIAARTMSEQSEALSEAHLMDEGSTMRILEFGRRNEVAEDGARHIVHESEEARRRYHSEPESAVQHIQAQHHEAQETAEQFRVQRERLQQECLSYVAEREEMYRQEMEAISMTLASDAEMIAANSENFQMNAQNGMVTKDQQLLRCRPKSPNMRAT